MDAMKIKTKTFTLRWSGPVHPAIDLLVGKLNAYTWRGYSAGHLMFSGLTSESTAEFHREYEATFVHRVGRRWDEYASFDGRWEMLPSHDRLVNFTSLAIPAAAVMSEPVEGIQFIGLPDVSKSWRDSPPLL